MSGAADVHQLGCAELRNTTYTRLVAVLGHPVAVLGHPVAVLGHSVVVLGHPVAVLGHPVAVLGHPVAVLGHPVALTTFPPTHCPPLRNQISVLNIEKDTLQLNVSRMIEDKDKMATQVDTDHDEMDRRTAQLLM